MTHGGSQKKKKNWMICYGLTIGLEKTWGREVVVKERMGKKKLLHWKRAQKNKEVPKKRKRLGGGGTK